MNTFLKLIALHVSDLETIFNAECVYLRVSFAVVLKPRSKFRFHAATILSCHTLQKGRKLAKFCMLFKKPVTVRYLRTLHCMEIV
jgi:hypothetical protein